MATDSAGDRENGSRPLIRHPRRVRWLHAGTLLATILLLWTGWWLLSGREADPSLLARALRVPDIRVHVWAGRALAILAIVALTFGRRAVRPFARETLRRDRGDGRWWTRWPRAVFTGRFARHEGRFDPGQRVANVVIVGGLIVLTVTGIALTLLHGGHTFGLLAKIHLWTAVIVTPFVLGHVLVAIGLLPGYRGVWRSMFGGRLPVDTARRLWPAWTERALSHPPTSDEPEREATPVRLEVAEPKARGA